MNNVYSFSVLPAPDISVYLIIGHCSAKVSSITSRTPRPLTAPELILKLQIEHTPACKQSDHRGWHQNQKCIIGVELLKQKFHSPFSLFSLVMYHIFHFFKSHLSSSKFPLYLYSAFNNTNCNKATAQYQNRKIVSIM